MRALDLCAGIGGFRFGVETSMISTDVQFVGYSDIDQYANKAYKSMYEVTGEVELGDIQKFTRLEDEYNKQGPLAKSKLRTQQVNKGIPDFDFLFAGFPCQPHSLMGNRKGNVDARGSLFYDIAELIRIKQPEYFILENVKAITSVNQGYFFNEIVDTLSNTLKYNLKVWSLNAADYGVPQTRRRVFFVGSRKNKLPNELPMRVCLEESEYPTTWHLLERNVSEKYFLSEKILKTILKDQHKGYSRKAEINKLIARPVCKSMHKMHRASQDNYYSEDFVHGQFDQLNKNVKFAEINSPRIRRITPKEGLRIQSFPDALINRLIEADFSDTRLYMMAGNAVPPQLVQRIINHIFQ